MDPDQLDENYQLPSSMMSSYDHSDSVLIGVNFVFSGIHTTTVRYNSSSSLAIQLGLLHILVQFGGSPCFDPKDCQQRE